MTPLFESMPNMRGIQSSQQPQQSPTQLNMSNRSISDDNLIMNILNKFEGYKTKIKELHWASSRFTNNQLNIHILMSELGTIVSDYQDKVAELSSSFMGHIRFNSLVPIPCNCQTPDLIIKSIKEDLNRIKLHYKDTLEGSGIINATDQFYEDLQNKEYLIQICL